KASSVSIRPRKRAKLAIALGNVRLLRTAPRGDDHMTKTLSVLAAAATLAAATLSVPSSAYADNGRITAGVLGGVAAGALIRSAIPRPAYPAYVVEEPVVVAPPPRCWREPRGPAYWDGYAWVQPTVRVCSRY